MKKTISLAIGLLIIVVVFKSLGGEVTEFLRHIYRIRLEYLPLVAVLSVTGLFIIAGRWSAIVRTIAPKTPFPPAFFPLTCLASSFSSFFLPYNTGNLGIRAVSVKKVTGTTWEKTFFLVLFDQILSMSMLTLMVIPCLFIFFDVQPARYYLTGSILFITLPFILLFFFRGLFFKGIDFIGLTIRRLVKTIPIKVVDQLVNKKVGPFLKTFMTDRNFNAIVLFSIAVYSVPVIRYYFIARSMSIDINFFVFFFSFPVIFLIIVFSPTPSALGFQEAGWVAVMIFHGVDHGLAVAFALSFRVIEKTLLVLMALFGYLYFLTLKTPLSTYWSKPDETPP